MKRRALLAASAAGFLAACAAPDSASIASSTPWYRSSGFFCISFSMTPTRSAGAPGVSSASGGACLNWWAIIFSTALPSGNGYRPVRQ